MSQVNKLINEGIEEVDVVSLRSFNRRMRSAIFVGMEVISSCVMARASVRITWSA